ncbi:MAG: hypothetical protein HZA54_11890 [Planctomycetes bacterium]|nr:hypothetical protein [Planctomycetota bacterium]
MVKPPGASDQPEGAVAAGRGVAPKEGEILVQGEVYFPRSMRGGWQGGWVVAGVALPFLVLVALLWCRDLTRFRPADWVLLASPALALGAWLAVRFAPGTPWHPAPLGAWRDTDLAVAALVAGAVAGLPAGDASFSFAAVGFAVVGALLQGSLVAAVLFSVAVVLGHIVVAGTRGVSHVDFAPWLEPCAGFLGGCLAGRRSQPGAALIQGLLLGGAIGLIGSLESASSQREVEAAASALVGAMAALARSAQLAQDQAGAESGIPSSNRHRTGVGVASGAILSAWLAVMPSNAWGADLYSTLLLWVLVPGLVLVLSVTSLTPVETLFPIVGFELAVRATWAVALIDPSFPHAHALSGESLGYPAAGSGLLIPASLAAYAVARRLPAVRIPRWWLMLAGLIAIEFLAGSAWFFRG